MSLTATLQPERLTSAPGATAALTLRLTNDAEEEQVVKLRAAGDLAPQTVLQSETIYLDPGETFELPVIVDVSSSLSAGLHTSGIEVSTGTGESLHAEATIEVGSAASHTVALSPEHSRSASSGRHLVVIDNLGNVPVTVDLAATSDSAARVELASPAVIVDPAMQAKVELQVLPPSRFWRGPVQNHDFVVRSTGSDGQHHELHGTFEQGPRLGSWVVPALAGLLAALVLGAIVWFTLLRPSVEQIADDAAADAIEAERAALQERIQELEAAAAEARQLPLGVPTDLRLTVEAAAGASANESFTVSSGRLLHVSDVVFQNPTGAIGTTSLLRNGEVLLESELANFRDLDFHFVAPFRFEGGDTVELRVDCVTPGPGTEACSVGTSLTGFVAEQP